jgi:twitching motility protein PilT
VEDFNAGLIQAMRQDPDVILVGEIRDIDTAQAALRASETGHLVLSTLHTSRAVQSVERILNMFPDAERASAREQLAANLRVVISQELVRRAENHGRIAVLEIMIVTKHLAQLLHENRLDEIEDVIRSGETGMQVFDQALADLVRSGKVAEPEGERFAHDVFAFKRQVKGIASTGDRGGIIGSSDHGGHIASTTNF